MHGIYHRHLLRCEARQRQAKLTHLDGVQRVAGHLADLEGWQRHAYVILQECNAHIRFQMQHLAESQAVEATAFLEQVTAGIVSPWCTASWLRCVRHIGITCRVVHSKL